MTDPSRLPSDVDLEKASAARCYDYYLGGSHNFEVDRELARKVESRVPHVKPLAQDNRAFLRRAVRYCLRQGIRQFLDIGSGIPTVGNVHEIAQELDPEARVLYVDNEPVAVAHSRTILEGNDRADVVQADLADSDGILGSEQAARLLDPERPIAVMMVALFHFVPDSARPAEILRSYHEWMAPGSFLGFSHVTGDHYPELLRSIVDLYADSSNPVTARSHGEISGLLKDFELVEPGLVYVPEWRPDTEEDRWQDPARSLVYGAVGHKV
ncbi:S-adenosyl methyltransferase [Actinopolyspora xinjiangensis]|uniref:S-adenosyl methyltransferase n=1 Tax=Actinopolyspora xinjiangensis TaxID=405564 RepID=A0A1H0TQ20_9ACTN|nr:SAM-dependent methyltransferase [Actinopolyspora xinjiangensis]SDP55875.1 S-adenosyl methyltransferase [Actinopolyspora xinjiangensis]